MDAQERAAFVAWRRELAAVEEGEGLVLTPFEKNLEVWRQLWRVLERSHIVVQARPALGLSPPLPASWRMRYAYRGAPVQGMRTYTEQFTQAFFACLSMPHQEDPFRFSSALPHRQASAGAACSQEGMLRSSGMPLQCIMMLTAQISMACMPPHRGCSGQTWV